MYNQNGLTVELITENGNKITEFTKDGLTFVEGRKNSKYKIKVTNHTYSRIKTIISVDGLDILTGKRATIGGGGYVIPSYGTEILDGWRISDQQVREFFFTSQANSYNAKTGNDTNNLGVIGVVAYKEYVRPIYQNYNILLSGRFVNPSASQSSVWDSLCDSAPVDTYSKGTTRGAAQNAIAPVGTGMGAVKESKVETVHTIWEASHFATNLIYYKTREELEAMGIKVVTIKNKPLPSAFAGYCKQV